jgi:hypothetical protein
MPPDEGGKMPNPTAGRNNPLAADRPHDLELHPANLREERLGNGILEPRGGTRCRELNHAQRR